METIRDFKKLADDLFLKYQYKKALQEGKTIEVDGETLQFVRLPDNPEKSLTPMNMKLDLDKIDITKEMSWCNFVGMVDEQSKRKEGKDGQEKL